MLKIALETSALNFNNAGTARVTATLGRALTELAPEDISISILPPSPNLNAARAGLSRKLFVLYWESFYVPALLPHRVRQIGADILHCLAPLPLSPAIRQTRARVITMIYDVIAFTHPQWFTPVMRRRLQRWTERSAEYSDHFTAISNFTRDTFCDQLSIPPERVKVTYLGGLEDSTSSGPRVVAGPYLLAVGTLEPRKNLETVLEAYFTLKGRLPGLPRLVLAGGQGWGDSRLTDTLGRLSLHEDVKMLGFVPDSQLAGLYQGAEMLIYPSLQEGFGLPPLEAMRLGCPVIASSVSAIPEVVGEAALRVDPTDAAVLARAIEQLLLDKDLAATLRRKGLQQADRFSWERCASETIALYREMIPREVDILDR